MKRQVVTINLPSIPGIATEVQMRKPNESLDDYIVQPANEVSVDPPRAVSLQLTGQVEVLQPLARLEVPAQTAYRVRFSPRTQPIWFQRFVAFGGGALVMTAFVLVSAILMGITDSSTIQDVAIAASSDENAPRIEEPFDIAPTFPQATWLDVVRPITKRKAVKTRQIASNRQRTYAKPAQAEEPRFVPTTLVIYPENGVIKTRIEPWVGSS